MAVRIIVDSTADLPLAAVEQVDTVRMTVRFGDREYIDGVDISKEAFYTRLVQEKELPTTSQPTPYDFEKAYETAVEAGDTVVCITVSSKVSGTYQSAVIAGEEYEGKVFVVDSRNVAIGTSILVLHALELREKGLCAEEIARELLKKRERIRLYAMVDTLEYLKKGGRISPTAAFAGGLLNLKPIITVENGELKIAGKARGNKQALTALNQLVEKAGGIDLKQPVMLGYTGLDNSLLNQYREESGQLWAGNTPEAALIGSVIGTHAGPGAVAIAFYAPETL